MRPPGTQSSGRRGAAPHGWSDGGPSDARAAGSPPFVGRVVEMAVLLAALDEARSGHGRLVLVDGAAGIGKTRLAHELAAVARDRRMDVLWGRSWEAGGAPAFWPWVQVLRDQVGRAKPARLRSLLGRDAADLALILPEIRTALPDAVPPPATDGEGARFRLFEAASSFLRRLAQARGLLVVIDDLHVADVPSLLLLQFLAGDLHDSRLLVVGMLRDEEMRDDDRVAATVAQLVRAPGTERISLAGLSSREVGRFAELVTGAALSDPLVATIHERTDGNPLFVGEIVRLLGSDARPAVDSLPGAGTYPVPHSVREAIARRVTRLAPNVRETLDIAAVAGREFDPAVLAEVRGCPPDELLGALERAIAARIVADDPDGGTRFRFTHVLVRDTIYDGCGLVRRVELHRRIGEALEHLHQADVDSHLSELALHFVRAAPEIGWAKALEYARRAGDHAAGLLAFEEAARLYLVALDALSMSSPNREMECRLLLALGEVRMRAGRMPDAKEAFLRAADIARAERLAEAFARAAIGYGGRFVWVRADPSGSLVPLLEEAIAMLGSQPSVLSVRLRARLSGALRDEPVSQRREALVNEAISMARTLGDPAALAYALDATYAAQPWPVDTERWLQNARDLIAAADAAGERERSFAGHQHAMGALFIRGDVRDADAELQAMARLSEEIRQPAQRWALLITQAMRAIFDGRFEKAFDLCQEANPLSAGASDYDAIFMPLYLEECLIIRREQGRLADLREPMERLVASAPSRPLFRAMLMVVYCEIGDSVAAQAELDTLASPDLGALDLGSDWYMAMALMTDGAVHLGDRARAAKLLELFEPEQSRLILCFPETTTGSVARYLGRLAALLDRPEEAVRHFELALRIETSLGARPWAAHTQYEYARLLATSPASGDRSRARDLVGRARGTARKLGMVVLEDRVAQLARQLEASPALPQEATTTAVERDGVGARNAFCREGEYWSIVFDGVTTRLHDRKGLHYLARLLVEPDREFHALDLVALEEWPAGMSHENAASLDLQGLRSGRLDDADPILDPEARAAYRTRLRDLAEELAQAEAWHDPERAARAREEHAFLVAELGRAVGLGGRDRPTGSAAERARVSVTKAIKAAVGGLRVEDPALGRHLQATVRTGMFCRYSPDPRASVGWSV